MSDKLNYKAISFQYFDSFLREKGINVPRYNAYGRAAQDAVIPPTTTTPINVNQTLNPMESTLESLTHNSDLIQIPITSLPTKKQSKKEQQKKRLLSDESDVDLNPMSRSKHTKLTKTNQRLDETDKLKQMLCERCNRKLHHAKQVCLACTSIPQKRRFVKIGLKSENTRYGTKSLFDISMNVISNHIHIIDDFGYLSKMAKQSLSKILSRRRQLTEKNLGLFLGKDEDVLELFDCTLITLHGYKQISTFCPNLKVLDLSLCGRINGMIDCAFTLYYHSAISSLTRLTLQSIIKTRRSMH